MHREMSMLLPVELRLAPAVGKRHWCQQHEGTTMRPQGRRAACSYMHLMQWHELQQCRKQAFESSHPLERHARA